MAELLTQKKKTVFDTTQIKEGDLICVDCRNWLEPKKGIVLRVEEDRITFLYHPHIANVTNRQTLTAADAADGKLGYRIRWTSDMESFRKYTSGDPEAPDPPKGLEEPEEFGEDGA